MRALHAIPLLLCLCISQALFAQECKESAECRKICKQHDDLALEGCLKLCAKLSCSAPVDDWVVTSPTPAPTSSRDWTINAPTPSSSPSTPVDDFTFDPTSRPCTAEIKSSCKDTCRFKFGDAFHSCTESCLSNRCDTAPSQASKHDGEDGLFCLEIESDDCVTQCKDGSSASKARCRRSCLEQRCPSANHADAAKEGLNPGRTKCLRCKDESLQECQTICAVPSTSHDHVRYGAIGCLKICQATKCFEPCN